MQHGRLASRRLALFGRKTGPFSGGTRTWSVCETQEDDLLKVIVFSVVIIFVLKFLKEISVPAELEFINGGG